MPTLIEKTTEYDVFIKKEGNRKIDERAVKKLMKSIKEDNFLDSNPIKISKDWEVIDGQHRLEAARRLNIEIPYVMDERLTTKSMLNFNTCQKAWEIGDFFNSYVSEGIEDYVKLKEILVNEGLSLSLGLQLLNGNRSTQFFSDFKEGKYKLPPEEELKECMQKKILIKETIEYIKKKTSGPKTYLDKVTFYTAMIEFFNIKSFDFKIFSMKLQYKLDLIRPCSHQSHYVAIFKTIYNWKNSKPLNE